MLIDDALSLIRDADVNAPFLDPSTSTSTSCEAILLCALAKLANDLGTSLCIRGGNVRFRTVVRT